MTGITPAYAGNSRHLKRLHVWYKDHPRIRGEQIPVVAAVVGVTGSPRIRGEQATYDWW
ncbi:uncharacterized protein SN13T_0504 [Lactiplantibacillus plantarum]|nr:uncharacterized protein SN13T_0504 [Lactiplantibacillus plantarum]